MRYISLKPLDKREKKRQQKIEAMRRMVKVAVSQGGGCGDNQGRKINSSYFKSVLSCYTSLKVKKLHVDFYFVNLVIGLTENEDISSNFEEEFIPRSPVPLPDASHCKPILVQLGFSLSKKEKKGNIMYSI